MEDLEIKSIVATSEDLKNVFKVVSKFGEVLLKSTFLKQKLSSSNNTSYDQNYTDSR
jgi:hypothetical protein